MKIKAKVTLGVVFLFLVIIGIGGLTLYYLSRLSNEAQNILTDNYESLEYTKRIVQSSDSLYSDSASSVQTIEKNLRLQEQNVTEPGEQQATVELRQAFEKLKITGIHQSHIAAIREACLQIQELNMQAIFRKNLTTQKTASNASTLVILFVSIFSIIAFTFIVNFPSYVADPIVQLTQSIKSIAGKNYEERLHFDRKDEFEELAEAFNRMAEKLDEYEHSNLAGILFEKKRIETIINRMSDPVIGLDELNKVVFANDEALLLLNLTPRQVVGRYAPDIAVENDLFRALIKQSGAARADAGLIKVAIEGKENYFSRENITISHSPTGEKDPVNIGQVILLKNVTPFKEMDVAKTNFIATISHELKTPIASLQMCVKLLKDNRVGTMNEEQMNITRTLGDEVSRIARITNELLDLAQVETGNIKLDLKKANPADIVQFAIEAVKFPAERKNITIRLEIAKDVSSVQADVDKTTWVLVNFLTNAIRYSPENGTVTVKCNVQNGQVNFSVSDEGPGIDRKYLDRIFDKYFQVPGTPGGTGLGLAISKEFIEAQGGHIHADSTVGSGSVFSFKLLKSPER